MKRIITLIAISLCLLSCKKDEEIKPDKPADKNATEYKFTCDECYIEIGRSPNAHKVNVKGFYIYMTIENEPETNILVSGKGKIRTQVKFNQELIFDKTDANGYFMYNVKLKSN